MTMIITCEKCQAKFKVAPEQIKESGSKVRCSNCQHVFTVFRPRPEPDLLVLDERIEGADEQYGERPASPKARRELRRRLYSDLEDEPGKATFDDSLDDLFDDEDEARLNPPIRRNRRPNEALGAADDELPPPLEERENRDALGLASDPVSREATPPRQEPGQGASIRAAESGKSSDKSTKILLLLVLVAALVLAGIHFMARRPEPLALSSAEPVAAPNAPPGTAPAENAAEADPAGTLGITFSTYNQNHYFRENVREGTILIITGMVRNSYSERRSFIHLRGRLISADGSTLADRYAYAGNLVSEEELINLPIGEIFSRLSIKGGQNGQNMNVAPGREVPFMLVFDKLPDGMTEYRIDPMGSTSAE